MEDRRHRYSRRKFLASAAALTLSGGMAESARTTAPRTPADLQPTRLSNQGRKPIAVVCSVYRPLSHAYHLVGRFLHGYRVAGQLHTPGIYVRSMFVDQLPENDLSRELARKFGFVLSPSIRHALTLGSAQLEVDGVLLLGEHGNYPRNPRGQILYPRFEWLEQVVAVFRQTGRSVPVFNAKHLSYDWARACQMAEWSREFEFALMAGSSVPLTWRRPELEIPHGSAIDEALVAAHGGLEVAGCDALEALEAMLERRRGGETGVRGVTCLIGEEVWRAGDAESWSWPLLETALQRSETLNVGDIRRNVGSLAVGSMPRTPPTAILIEYNDGTRGTVLLLNGHIQDFCFAARVRGEPRPLACLFCLPGSPGLRQFDCLAAKIEELVTTRQSPTPLARTLLTTGILEAAMESHHRRGQRVATPALEVAYSAPDESGFRRGEIGVGG